MRTRLLNSGKSSDVKEVGGKKQPLNVYHGRAPFMLTIDTSRTRRQPLRDDWELKSIDHPTDGRYFIFR